MRLSDPAVRAEGLVLAYGSSIALAESSFLIPTGAITAVIGPNGSGKSTLLAAIAGLIEPAAGSIEVLPGHDHLPRISFVLQTTKVNDALPVSVREVVNMGRYAGRGLFRRLDAGDAGAVEEAMLRTEIADLGGRHLNTLSGGQRQRAFVAQGLAQEHDILLLDEPLSGIDMAAAQAIDEVIHDEISRGCSVIMTTHDLSEARVADHVVLLSGVVVASGPPSEALSTPNLAKAYGTSLLHADDERVLVDDAAHQPTAGRHVHRERSIHTETSQRDHHRD